MRTSYLRPSEANRHRRPWADGSRSKFVPVMHTSERGDLKDGLIRVPRRLAFSGEDTNARHEFTKLVTENLRRWDELMTMTGWEMASKPKVRGPYEPPTASVAHEADPDEYWYWASAYFKRTSPIYVPFDDFLASKDEAELFDIDTAKAVTPWSQQDNAETGWETGHRFATRLFEEKGKKIEDYRYEDESVPTDIVDDLKAGKTVGLA